MKNMFSIGEVSKCQNISKQTLIFYDKIGLFQPAYVDPNNGYRYYSANQIDYLDTILIMKKIGFSLSEIKKHMQHYNISSSLIAFRKQVDAIDQRIQELRLIRNRVLHRCDQMESAIKYRGNDNDVIIEGLPVQYILFREVEKPYTLKEISLATKNVLLILFKSNCQSIFSAASLFLLNTFKKVALPRLQWLFCRLKATISPQISNNFLLENALVSIMWEIICRLDALIKSCYIIVRLIL